MNQTPSGAKDDTPQDDNGDTKTQRAYTLRLRGSATSKDDVDNSWKEALWDTHEAVNKGAKEFADFLLTIRGGLPSSLDKEEYDGTTINGIDTSTIKNRRILLALSWLSVESKSGSPEKFIVKKNGDKIDPVKELGEILKSKGLNDKEIEEWEKDCEASLNATIRDDAVWVNRSKAFDELRSKAFDELNKKIEIKEEDIWDMLGIIFIGEKKNKETNLYEKKNLYFLMPKTDKDSKKKKKEGDNKKDDDEEDKNKQFAEKAGNWLSNRFGDGDGANYEKLEENYKLIGQWAEKCSGNFSEGEPLEDYFGFFPSITVKDIQDILKLATATGKKSGAKKNLRNKLENTTQITKEYFNELRKLAKIGQWAEIGQWSEKCSANFSEGKPLEYYFGFFPSITVKTIKDILQLVTATGRESGEKKNLRNKLENTTQITKEYFNELRELAEIGQKASNDKIGKKDKKDYANYILAQVEGICGFTYLNNSGSSRSSRHSNFCVMLDHAARGVSQRHSWIKINEGRRNEFESDSKKITTLNDEQSNEQINEQIKILDTYCKNRSDSSGAIEGYRIRKSAIAGWDKICLAWNNKDCETKEDRINKAKELQDDKEIDKFGDINLFTALAEAPDDIMIWENKDTLENYVKAKEAEYNKTRFKVPAYRHPDPLLHPVFCDFGKSRWDIEYLCKKNNKEDSNPKNKKKAKNVSQKIEVTTEAHESENIDKRIKITLFANDTKKTIEEQTLEEKTLYWQSKRFIKDLDLKKKSVETSVKVSRADRLGRVAVGANKNDNVNILNIFDETEWNGRLQAPRYQLEAIAKIRDSKTLSEEEKVEKIKKLKNNLKWFLTCSLKLEHRKPAYNSNPTYKIVELPENKTILWRLPNLRLLSVDLGHRYAAGCACWETISNDKLEEDFNKAQKANILVEGQRLPLDSDLYFHLKTNDGEKKKTTIYRRIGANKINENGTEKDHPAPWARLERQFLIKLQGEEEGVRQASNDEIWKIHNLEKALRINQPLIDRLVSNGFGENGTEKQRTRIEELKKLGWLAIEKISDSTEKGDYLQKKDSLEVDELMYSTVRELKLALKRHGDLARIAFYIHSDYKISPGGKKDCFTNNNTNSNTNEDDNGFSSDDDNKKRNEHIEFVTDGLKLYLDLALSNKYQNTALRDLWDKKLGHISGNATDGNTIDELAKLVDNKKIDNNKGKYSEIVNKISNIILNDKDKALRKSLFDELSQIWNDDDKILREHIKIFKQLIMPNKKNGGATASNRQVGGLSLTRISTITEFRQKVSLSYYTRLHPDGSRKEAKENFGQRSLNIINRLREQRVKQLSSRIVEAALGVGRIKKDANIKYPKRPEEKVDEPCHVVVIEDLKEYRPDELKTRRENRQLMSWSAKKIKKCLEESCQLNGLIKKEVAPSYTSRQDSRTGSPGMRCSDISASSSYWKKLVIGAEKKAHNDEGGMYDYIVKMNDHYKNLDTNPFKKCRDTIRVPIKGGELFVSANENSPAKNGLQADLNAAANIGLKAVTDPDWVGNFWYIPCYASTFKPKNEKLKKILSDPNTSRAKKQKNITKDIINLWCDISSEKILDYNHKDNKRTWKPYSEYQKDIEKRVINNLLDNFNEKKGGKK